MLRRQAIKLLGLGGAALQLAPWLEQKTPAKDVIGEILDSVREMFPGEQVDFFVSNLLYRQLKTELPDSSAPDGWHPVTFTSQPGLGNFVVVKITIAKNHFSHGKYPLANYTHIKGIELLLESERPTR
jgi:hypothetical protein